MALVDFGRNPHGWQLESHTNFCQVNNARFHRFPVSQMSQNLNTTRRSRWKRLEQNNKIYLHCGNGLSAVPRRVVGGHSPGRYKTWCILLKCVNSSREVVSVLTSWSWDAPTSHLDLVSTKNYNVSVSGGWRLGLVLAICVLCPRCYFSQILQATLIKWT